MYRLTTGRSSRDRGQFLLWRSRAEWPKRLLEIRYDEWFASCQFNL